MLRNREIFLAIFLVSLTLFSVVVFILIGNNYTMILKSHATVGTQDKSVTMQEPGNIEKSTKFPSIPLEWANYSGPMVKGWEPWVDRNVSLYILPEENTVLTDLTCLSLSKTRVLIMIQSAPSMHERRQGNRQTWMKDEERFPQVKTLFIFGTDSNDSLPALEIQKEAEQYCDIVQIDFVDTYENVTLDSVSALKFALSWWKYNEGNDANQLDFVVLGDDDTYINIPNLWDRLYHYNLTRDSKELVGSLFMKSAVMRWTEEDAKKAIKDPALRYVDRAISPKYMYAGNHYPNWLGGGAYIMPFGTLDCLYLICLNLPFFHINDIFVTGFAAERCGFQLIDDTQIFSGRVEAQEFSLDIISTHWSTTNMKHLFHEVLNRDKGMSVQRLPNRYWQHNGTLSWCDFRLNCTEVKIEE